MTIDERGYSCFLEPSAFCGFSDIAFLWIEITTVRFVDNLICTQQPLLKYLHCLKCILFCFACSGAGSHLILSFIIVMHATNFLWGTCLQDHFLETLSFTYSSSTTTVKSVWNIFYNNEKSKSWSSVFVTVEFFFQTFILIECSNQLERQSSNWIWTFLSEPRLRLFCPFTAFAPGFSQTFASLEPVSSNISISQSSLNFVPWPPVGSTTVQQRVLKTETYLTAFFISMFLDLHQASQDFNWQEIVKFCFYINSTMVSPKFLLQNLKCLYTSTYTFLQCLHKIDSFGRLAAAGKKRN